jgi:hypothetical protein
MVAAAAVVTLVIALARPAETSTTIPVSRVPSLVASEEVHLVVPLPLKRIGSGLSQPGLSAELLLAVKSMAVN